MLILDSLIKRFNARISFFVTATRNLAAANLLDQAVLSEALARDIASILLGRSFKGVNTSKANKDTIDLEDLSAPPICAQVTIREDREKIDQTLEAFFKKQHHKKYRHIYFFLFGLKPDYDKKKPFVTQDAFEFDPVEHIIDMKGMVRLAQALELADLQELVRLVEQHIPMNDYWRWGRTAVVTSLLVAMGMGAYAWKSNQATGVPVPGNTTIERQINRAKLEGAAVTTASAEWVTAVPYVFPIFFSGDGPGADIARYIALSNSSPLRPLNQDIVFDAGRCRLFGAGTQPIGSVAIGNASITSISCVMHNGDSYSYGDRDGPEIGFVTTVEYPANRDLPLVQEGPGSMVLSGDSKYRVQFLQPIAEMRSTGKSSINW